MSLVGQAAPNFELKNERSETITLNQYKVKYVVHQLYQLML